MRTLLLLLLLPCWMSAASHWVAIRTTEGKVMEGQTTARSIQLQADGKTMTISLEQLLSAHSAAPASAQEKARIEAGLAAIQATDRVARDAAVEELTVIGLPVLTPLLDAYKDTDQHEPRPLYRLFERIIPSNADGFDRTLSLVRLSNGQALRGALSGPDIALSGAETVPFSQIRTLAVRQKQIKRFFPMHSLRHCTKIEYLDSGVMLSSSSKLDFSARGFVRLSFNVDGWASDPNGLTKPGSPAYKTNLIDGHPFGAIVGRIGAGGQNFLLGKQATKTGLAAGRLMLAINDNNHWQNNLGSFTVTFTVTDAYDLGDAQ